MSWNYRIVRYSDGSGYGLHEVHYDMDEHPISITEEPAAFVGDSSEEIVSALMMAKMDAWRRPVFEEPDEWRKQDRSTSDAKLTRG